MCRTREPRAPQQIPRTGFNLSWDDLARTGFPSRGVTLDKPDAHHSRIFEMKHLADAGAKCHRHSCSTRSMIRGVAVTPPLPSKGKLGKKNGSSDSRVLRCCRPGNVCVPKGSGEPRLFELEQRDRTFPRRPTSGREERMNQKNEVDGHAACDGDSKQPPRCEARLICRIGSVVLVGNSNSRYKTTVPALGPKVTTRLFAVC